MGVGQQLCSMASTIASHSCAAYHFAAFPRADALVCNPTFIVGARFMVPVSWQQKQAFLFDERIPQDHFQKVKIEINLPVPLSIVILPSITCI